MAKEESFAASLCDLTRAQAQRAGAKAANLGDLLRAGFPVPDGFVLTTDAFARFLSANNLGAQSSPDAVAAATLPPEIEQALRAAVAPFGDAALAVRSSAVAEDLAGASFAGQYETVLDVRGFDALADAVRRCWASAFSARVAAYLAERGETNGSGMAVLVQRLVPAEAAGVAFSANPVTGARDECVVSAVRGLGERLVSGQASPDEWLVRGAEPVCRAAPEAAITGEQAATVAELARRAAAHFGAPQDVEWALADGRLFLLQSRPITALPEPPVEPVPVAVEPPPGFWERESAHFAEPLSPMMRSAVLPVHEQATSEVFREIPLPIDGIQFREIGGWVYQRTAPPGGKDGPPPPAWLMKLLVRLAPPLRRLARGMVEAFRSDMTGKAVEQWYTDWKPATIARINEFKQVDPASLSDGALAEHLAQALAFVHDCVGIHPRITAADLLVAELALTCRELFGWDDGQSLALLGGLSGGTMESTLRLSELAQMAQARPAVRRLVAQIGPETPQRLAAVDEEFAAGFQGYLQEFGARTLRWDVAEATVAEKPEVALRTIHNQLARRYDPAADAAALAQRRAAAMAEAERLLADQSPAAGERFERALRRAERAYPVREEHEHYLSNVPFALLRHALLEIGRRMAERGQLAQADDIMFLELAEAQAALQDGADRRELVLRRKGERAWVKAHPGPAFYGQPAPPPPIDAFPPEAQRLLRQLFWVLEGFSAAEYSQQARPADDGVLHGLAASPGQYTGPARIIRNESEFGKLQAGDVLVCPTTQPPWSVLFPSVGALVTDAGGILSHPAIIAREYCLPAVVATGQATSTLHDGEMVTVDGNTGEVRVAS